MKKEEFYFDSKDGESNIYAVRYTPDNGEVRCVVQIVHGMAEYVERYEEFAQFLTGQGFVVTGNDHLGHGKTVTERGIYGYFCEQDPATVVVRDVHRLKKLTQTLYPNVPYVIVGHSMGSIILRNYMQRYGTGISGAVIMGTTIRPGWLIQMGKAAVAVQKMVYGSAHISPFIDNAAFGSYNKHFKPLRTGYDWLSRDKESVDRYVDDSLCGFVFTVNGFQTSFELLSRVQKKDNLKKIPKELPVFMLSGAEDPVGDFGDGVMRVYASLQDIGLNNMQLKLYDKDRHELLQELDRDVVAQDIFDWISNTILV